MGRIHEFVNGPGFWLILSVELLILGLLLSVLTALGVHP